MFQEKRQRPKKLGGGGRSAHFRERHQNEKSGVSVRQGDELNNSDGEEHICNQDDIGKTFE